jgi:hypothetical protein
MTGLGSADAISTDVTIGRMEDQIAWYDRSSSRDQRRYKMLKTATLVMAGLVPLLAMLPRGGQHIAAILGFGILVAEGTQQLHQFEQHWLQYRSTAEMLKHEKYLFLAAAGPYAETENGRRLLAERVESLVSQEHAQWVAAQERSRKPSDERKDGKTDEKKE